MSCVDVLLFQYHLSKRLFLVHFIAFAPLLKISFVKYQWGSTSGFSILFFTGLIDQVVNNKHLDSFESSYPRTYFSIYLVLWYVSSEFCSFPVQILNMFLFRSKPKHFIFLDTKVNGMVFFCFKFLLFIATI